MIDRDRVGFLGEEDDRGQDLADGVGAAESGELARGVGVDDTVGEDPEGVAVGSLDSASTGMRIADAVAVFEEGGAGVFEAFVGDLVEVVAFAVGPGLGRRRELMMGSS